MESNLLRVYRTLSEDQIKTFLEDGVLVVENVLSSEELEQARNGLQETLRRHGVHMAEDPQTAQNLVRLSSTNGSGGVLDLFYEPWKFKVALHPKLFAITSELWKAAYSEDQLYAIYGPFDVTKGYMYLDRIGYRLPTILAQSVGSKKRPIQRSLTPHLDCCPETLYDVSKATKWRPIQSLVSLSETLLSNHGGFEAVKGFHREFHTWTQMHRHSSHVGFKDSYCNTCTYPPPCIGDYTHIRPREDKAIMDRVEHIPVPAGSAVFWDQRIPHANAYRHDGTEPRAVVYCSFLPDIPLNRTFVRKQLSHWRHSINPSDQWIRSKKSETLNIPEPEDVLHTLLEQQLAGFHLQDDESV